MPTAAFLLEMDRKRDSQPRTKIEFITKASVVTDITRWYLSGANLEQVKERAPDEIQAGQFDIVFSNHDDKFSEYVTTSLLYNVDYHGARIRISQGFVLPDGTEEYLTQGVGYIDQLITDPQTSRVTIRCRDRLWRIMDQKIHIRPDDEFPLPNGSNAGNGACSVISTRPFYVVAESWTLTCTLGGGDGTATFSVVGSVSGSIGPATSGTEFVSLAKGIKFTIRVGSLAWVIGDSFTFNTHVFPQWNLVNAGKIIWSVLTGYNWDSDTQEAWSSFVFNFDHTKSSSNTDLDYDSFVDAIARITTLGVFNLKGFANYDTDAVEFLQELLVLVLGSLYTGADGRIKCKVYIPTMGAITRTFTDADKVTALNYNRSIDEVINSVSVNYIATDNWRFSDQGATLDGAYTQKDSTSITNYKELGVSFDIAWFTTSGLHVQDFADKLLARYAAPPLNVSFDTGMDALETEIGDYVGITDSKYGLQAVVGEVARILKQFDQRPAKVSIILRRDSQVAQQFGWIGSSINEGDGESPQNDDYDLASVADKRFAYFGDVNPGPPDYRIF